MKKKNKKMSKKGFTLIELLAVIVIMGILMLVAIPAMQRYIKNSRNNTYINTVKEMVNAAKNAAADKDNSLGCGADKSGAAGDSYTIKIVSNDTNALDSKVKSPLKDAYITVLATVSNNKVTQVAATDGTNTIAPTNVEEKLTVGKTSVTIPEDSSSVCYIK